MIHVDDVVDLHDPVFIQLPQLEIIDYFIHFNDVELAVPVCIVGVETSCNPEGIGIGITVHINGEFTSRNGGRLAGFLKITC